MNKLSTWWCKVRSFIVEILPPYINSEHIEAPKVNYKGLDKDFNDRMARARRDIEDERTKRQQQEGKQ